MAFTKINAAGIGTTETVTVDGLTVINDGSFGGNLTVGGVLTYEDVTNVDSVGLITARNGIVVGSGITLSKDGDVFFTGIATGNGSGLTNLPAQATIANNADNRVITGGSGVNLNGESNLTYDGNDLTQTTNANGEGIKINGGDNSSSLTFNANRGTQAVLGVVYGRWNSTTVAQMSFVTGDDGTDKNDGYITFGTESAASNGNANATERLRIDSSGKFGIGMSSDQQTALKGKLDIDASGIDAAGDTDDPNDYAIVIRNPSSTNSGNGIAFTNDSGAAVGGAIIHIDKGTNNIGDLAFLTSASSNTPVERVRITSDGKLGLGLASPDRTIHCHNSSNTTNVRAKFSNGTTGEGASDGFEIGINGSDPAQAVLVNNEASAMAFFTNASERLRIDSSGTVRIAHTSFTGDTGADDLIVGSGNSGINRGITILNHTGADGRICFAQSDDPDAGMIKYSHGSDVMQFFVESSEKMRISSNGDVDIADAVGESHSAKLAVEHSGINPNGIFVLSAPRKFSRHNFTI